MPVAVDARQRTQAARSVRSARSAQAQSIESTLSAMAMLSWTMPVTVVAVVVTALNPLAGAGIVSATIILAVVLTRPEAAAYLYLGLAPLLAGFGRGSVVPLLRPNEAMLAVLAVAVAARLLAGRVTGNGLKATTAPAVGYQVSDRYSAHYKITALDRAILAMALLSSVVPLLWRISRGYRPLADDLLYATSMWKYLLIFVLFRLVVVNEQQVRACLMVMLSTGVIVGLIAIAQSVGAPGVPAFLAWLHSEPLAAVANNRGSSTLGTSHGTADLMAFNLALMLGLFHRRVGSRPLVALGALFFTFACFASGQVSAAIALFVVALTFGFLTGRLARALLIAVPTSLMALAVLWPVVQARLADVGANGVPDSWQARYTNLTTYFWPELSRRGNWILGVRPAGRLPSFEPWRDWVYIESGHTWLLWTGGVPLLIAFLWFTWQGLRSSTAMISMPSGLGGSTDLGAAVGLTAAISLSVVFVLMLFDVHITLRGPADTLFPLLALVTVPGLWDSSDRWNSVILRGARYRLEDLGLTGPLRFRLPPPVSRRT